MDNSDWFSVPSPQQFVTLTVANSRNHIAQALVSHWLWWWLVLRCAEFSMRSDVVENQGGALCKLH